LADHLGLLVVTNRIERLDRVDALGRPRRDLVCWQILS
jgi:hypothetical protein